MKEKTYEKAMKLHEEKLKKYSNMLHDLVDDMREDKLSWNDIFGILETEKLFRFDGEIEIARGNALMDVLGDLADIFDEEE